MTIRAELVMHLAIALLLLLSILAFAVGIINLTSTNGWSFAGGLVGGLSLMAARWLAYEMGNR